MTREEYIYQLLKSNIIKYECVGSECSKDCIRVSSHIFHDKQAIVIWMPKMAWDNNEHILSKYIASYIGAGHLELILDACMTTDAFEDELQFIIGNRRVIIVMNLVICQYSDVSVKHMTIFAN